MSRAMALAFSLYCGSAIFAVANAAVGQEKPRLIRGEESQVMMEVSSHSHVASLQGKARPAAAGMLKSKPQEQGRDLCNENYVVGTALSNECEPGTTHIDNLVMCTNAAASMGLERGRAPGKSFIVPQEQEAIYPQDCFQKADDDGALFFNGVPTPLSATHTDNQGAPICHRPKFITGKNGTNDEGCKDGPYGKVMVEEECRRFAACRGHCAPEEFRVGLVAPEGGYEDDLNDVRPFDHTEEWFDKRPEGCFIHNNDGCVYFNVPRENADPTGTIEGTPVCLAVTGTHHDQDAVDAANAASSGNGGAASANAGDNGAANANANAGGNAGGGAGAGS